MTRSKREGGIRFAARWADQERLVMLTVLENLVGEGKADGKQAARRMSVLESC